MRFFAIVFTCVLVLMSYGIVHDQITVRVCPEYFTVAHPPILDTSSRTMMALAWGVLTTALAGIPFGFLVASAACHGRRLPPVGFSFLRRHLGHLWVAMVMVSTILGVGGFFLAQAGVLTLPAGLVELIPADQHARFLAAWSAHIASYAAGLLGALALIYCVLQERKRLRGSAAALRGEPRPTRRPIGLRPP